MPHRSGPTPTFDNLLVDAANRVAAAAGRRAAEAPGSSYNPLFIFGPPGVGKSHLLNAVAQRAREVDPQIRVHHESLDSILDRAAESVSTGRLGRFRESFSALDLLILDDLHRVSGQERVQAEMFRVIEEMVQRGAQVVVGSEEPPQEIAAFDAQLAVRLASGLVVDVGPPEQSTRLAMVRLFLRERRGDLEPELLKALAAMNIRSAHELRGAVNRLVAEAELGARRLSPGDLPRLLNLDAAGMENGSDEFGAFLSHISTAVAAVVETAPWRRRLARGDPRWEGEGFRTRRLEAALDADDGPRRGRRCSTASRATSPVCVRSRARLDAPPADPGAPPRPGPARRGGGAARRRRVGSPAAGGHADAPGAPRRNARRLVPRRREDRVGVARPRRPDHRGAGLMAIKGSLREASLPDVLQLLALGQKTGCLSLTDRSNFGYIYFDRGRITYASIVNRRDRLGDLLVKNGLIRSEELHRRARRAGKPQPGSGSGEILIETRRDHPRAAGALHPRPDRGGRLLPLHLDAGLLLLRGGPAPRRRGDARLHQPGEPPAGGRPPGRRVVADREEDPLARPDLRAGPLGGGTREADLTAEQRRILPLVDGQRSVGDLIDEAGMVEFDVGKALFGLIQAGLRAPGRAKEAARCRRTSRRRASRSTATSGIAFYRTGMYDEAAREFRRVLELQPADLDARFHLGLIGLRQGDDARRASATSRSWWRPGGAGPRSFRGMALALERLGRLDDALLAAEEAARLAPADPRTLLSPRHPPRQGREGARTRPGVRRVPRAGSGRTIGRPPPTSPSRMLARGARRGAWRRRCGWRRRG